jgi:hypothetical protein
MIIGCDLHMRYQQIAMIFRPTAEKLSIGKSYTIGLNSLHLMRI